MEIARGRHEEKHTRLYLVEWRSIKIHVTIINYLNGGGKLEQQTNNNGCSEGTKYRAAGDAVMDDTLKRLSEDGDLSRHRPCTNHY